MSTITITSKEGVRELLFIDRIIRIREIDKETCRIGYLMTQGEQIPLRNGVPLTAGITVLCSFDRLEYALSSVMKGSFSSFDLTVDVDRAEKPSAKKPNKKLA